MKSKTYSKFIATLAAFALGGCGGNDDPHVLRLQTGQQITATTDVGVNLMPGAIGIGDEVPCTQWMVIADIESTPTPMPDYVIPKSASVFSGAQLLWSGPFNTSETWRDSSSGHITTYARGCIGPQFNFDLKDQPVSTRLTLDLNGELAEITAPDVPLGFSY
jgi:hypothetical protein